MYFAARLHVILILVMALGLVVMTQPVPATETQPPTPSSTVGDTAKHDEILHDKASVILISGYFILLNIIIVVGLCLVWFEGRDTGGAVEETRDAREVVEEFELTDRLTWGRS